MLNVLEGLILILVLYANSGLVFTLELDSGYSPTHHRTAPPQSETKTKNPSTPKIDV